MLWCRKSPEGHEAEPGLHHPTIGKLSLSTSSKWYVSFFESGKDQATKGE